MSAGDKTAAILKDRGDSGSVDTFERAHDFEMRERILGFDWSTTPLGPIGDWPQSLRTVVNILLSSRYQMWMAWGPELTFFCNDAYRPTLGIKHSWALGKPASEVWSEIWPDIGPLIETVLETGNSTYKEGLLLFLERSGFPEETYHTFSYSPLTGDDGRINGMLCVVTEETDRLIGERRVETLRDAASALARANGNCWLVWALQLSMKKRREEAERAVQESQATLQSFYDSAPFLMGIAELDGENIRVVYGNRAMAEFFGIRDRVIAGLDGRDMGVPVDVDRIWIEQCRRSEADASPVRFEYEHPTASGKRWLSAAVTSLGAGRFSFIAEDVTEERRAEEVIRRSNAELQRANADLEQFAYSASHDLQEPLRQVAVYSQLLEKKFGPTLDAKALTYLDYCVEGAHRMESLITDLLAYSQAGNTATADADAVDLNDVIENVTKNLATAIAETGAVIRTSPLPKVHGHSVSFTLLFQNLISNALKYRAERAPEIAITAESDGAYWRFAVRDNGIGIAPEFRKQIFGIFKRLHDRKTYPGTGIGLAICQKIVERARGRIWVESEDSQGSTFLFTLPREKAQ